MEGYLFKQGEKGLVKSWRRRWFLMDDEKMFYFKDKGEPVVGFINLNQAGTVTVNDRTHARDGYGFQIETNQRVWYLSAPSVPERESWMKAIQAKLLAAKPDGATTLEVPSTSSAMKAGSRTTSTGSNATNSLSNSGSLGSKNATPNTPSKRQNLLGTSNNSSDSSRTGGVGLGSRRTSSIGENNPITKKSVIKLSQTEDPAIFEFEEDALVDKPVEKFLPDDEEDSIEQDRVDFIDDDNVEDEDEVLSQLATSVPVDIPLKSMAKTWHDRYLDSDDETGPRERSKTVQFEKPHELAAKTYQDVYLRNGLELDVPMSVSTKKRIKAYI